MKAIMISIRPQHVANILNGIKTLEIRKRFPSDYVGWVYIYCTKEKLSLAEYLYKDGWVYDAVPNYDYAKSIGCAKEKLNGKVVARFWCDKVEDFGRKYAFAYKDNHFYEILEKACMDTEELGKYYQPKRSDWENGKVHLYAIHISQLEIFDKPREISEFHKQSWAEVRYKTMREEEAKKYRLTRAPQSWYYIEV